MPSPLPGMDPYLEQPAFWSSFHSRFMVALADAIETNLSADYYVEVEARIYLDDSAGGVLIGIPDVVVAAPSAVDQLPTAIAGPIAVQVKPQPVEVPVPEVITERYLEVREVATGAVITAIEKSEEHTSELQSRPHISYAVFCLKKKKKQQKKKRKKKKKKKENTCVQ